MSDAHGGRSWWQRATPYLTPVVLFSATTVIFSVIAADSYDHEYLLAYGNGQTSWVAATLPVSVDGLVLIAVAAFVWAISQGIRRPWHPIAALAVATLATVGANLESGLHHVWLQRAVSVWPGIAVALVADVVMWYLNTQRKLANGEPLQPAAACSCPRPPVTLAEALPMARAELRDRGEPHGEQVLADRFGVPRARVRPLLAPIDPAGPEPPTPARPARAAQNGHADA